MEIHGGHAWVWIPGEKAARALSLGVTSTQGQNAQKTGGVPALNSEQRRTERSGRRGKARENREKEGMSRECGVTGAKARGNFQSNTTSWPRKTRTEMHQN